MRNWISQPMANTKVWGVTGREADHPFPFSGEISWVEVTYKIVVASLKYGAVKNLPEDETPLFSERDVQQTALRITQQLFSEEGDGQSYFPGEFLRDFGTSAKDDRSFLKGVMTLRRIVLRFLGELQ